MKKHSAEEKQRIFTELPVGKAVFVLAWPAVTHQITTILYNLSNTFFTGQSGDPNAVAALTLGYPLCILMTAIANLFGAGAGSAISLSLGAGDKERARKAGAFAFYGCAFTTILLSLLVYVFSDTVLRLLGADANTWQYTYDYIFWIFVLGCFPTVMSLVMGYMLRAEGYTKEASLGLMVAGFLNLMFSPLFIRILGFGSGGAAMGTTTAYSICLVYFLYKYNRIKEGLVLRLDPKGFSLKEGVPLEVLRLGFPMGISSVLTSLAAVVMSRLSAAYESSFVAAYDIAKRLTNIPTYIAKGASQGAAALIVFNFGAKNFDRSKKATEKILQGLLLFSFVFFLLLQVFAPLLGRAFIGKGETALLAARFTRAAAFGVVGSAIQLAIASFLQGVGAWKQSSLLNVLRNGVLYALCPLLFDRLWGMEGLMYSTAAADILSALMALWMYRRFWKQQAAALKSV